MNRFTRNNLLLIIVIAFSCVAATGLLVFSLIKYVSMTKCIAEVQAKKEEVRKLSNENPSPTAANKEPLQKNTVLYNAAADKLAVYFRHPMQKLAEEFISKLKETNPPKEDGKVQVLTVERFKREFEEMWSKGQSYVNKKFDYQGFREQRFSNWNQVVKEILPKAKLLTMEPINEENLPEVLFAHIGIPRVLEENPDNMAKFIKDYQNVLVNLMTGVKFDVTAVSFGFGNEISGTSIFTVFNNPRDHFPNVIRVWNIYGDVIKRMVECSKKVVYVEKGRNVIKPWSSELVSQLTGSKTPFSEIDDKIDLFGGLCLRGAMDPKNTNPDALRNAVAGEEDGPFKVFRMRISVSGTLAGIRTFVRSLDAAYKVNQIYVIRSIALYAEQDGAFEIFRRHAEQSGIKTNLTGAGQEVAPQKEQQSVQRRGRGRGRGRVANMESAANEETSRVDAAKLEEIRRQEEEAIKNLPYYDRPGYGDVLIGDSKNCRAVIDFDVFQLK
ncbi:MAG: hypothetical protein E7048_07055 [Lentisphaerae bacterium]|nr:hypothetical protein [Lentisphaerota bacterium]